MSTIAEGLEAPYYVASFSIGPGVFAARDADAASRLILSAMHTAGFLGLETTQDDDGGSTTISYWQAPEAIERWKSVCDRDLLASHGLKAWFNAFGLSVGKVDRHPLFKWIKRAA